MNKNKLILTIGCAVILCISTISVLIKNSNSSSLTGIPIYAGAYNIKHYSNPDAIVYRVKINFPATAVYQYYDSALKKLGYNEKQKYDSNSYKYSWQYYYDSTIDRKPFVAQNNIEWVNASISKKAVLILRYYWYDKNETNYLEKNDGLNVELQVIPL